MYLITGITIHCVAGATIAPETTPPQTTTSPETTTPPDVTTPPETSVSLSTLDNPPETYLPPPTDYNHTTFYPTDYYDYPATPPPLPPPLPTPYKQPILLSDIQSQLSVVLQNQDQIMTTLKNLMQAFSSREISHSTTLRPSLPDYSTQPKPLVSIDEVLKRASTCNNGKHEIDRMGYVAVALARDAIFGENIMRASTVDGKGSLRALPVEGLQEIHRTIFSLCPSFHHNAAEFDSKVWLKCKAALNHACNRLRTERGKVVQ